MNDGRAAEGSCGSGAIWCNLCWSRKRSTSSSAEGGEHEVARLIARGYTNRRIADELVLTPGTVANHVATFFRNWIALAAFRSRSGV